MPVNRTSARVCRFILENAPAQDCARHDEVGENACINARASLNTINAPARLAAPTATRAANNNVATPCEYLMVAPGKTLRIPSRRVCAQGGGYVGIAMAIRGFDAIWDVGGAREFVTLLLHGAA